jgi:predicted nuclease of predicted toxin-antitoxin system
MKLLFDENLSPKLPRLLATQFPGSLHLRDCGLKGATDEAIWKYAGANNFTIVSKDSDFYQRSLFYGSPSKFVWLSIGNRHLCRSHNNLSSVATHST